MSWLTRIKRVAKASAARLLAVLFWRLRPHRTPNIAAARRLLLVRADNRVGEALLMTPLISTLKNAPRPFEVSLLTHEKIGRVLEGHPEIDRLFTINPREAWLGTLSGAIRELRAARFDIVIDCTNWEIPSVTSAVLSRIVAGPAPVIGPSSAPCGRLRDIPVPPLSTTESEIDQRLNLLSPLGDLSPARRLSFRSPRIGNFGEYLAAHKTRPLAVVNPGGRLVERRAPMPAFTAAARELLTLGIQPIVSWGPGERPIAQQIVDAVPGAELAPPTDIDQLAALMQSARMAICNNTGPMHLAVAVGCPTLAFFFRMDSRRWGYEQPPHGILNLTDLSGNPAQVEEAVKSRLRDFSSALGRRHSRT